MPRYFLELSYKGTNYSGFQVQENARTIQSEVEKAMYTYYRREFSLTGSSRTDAGVHALQNFFHFDTDLELSRQHIYNLNAILPPDIAAAALYKVADDAHSRFGAVAREYRYYIYGKKNPFLTDRAWYYPFRFDLEVLQEAAERLRQQVDFVAFSKRNTQVSNFRCQLEYSHWTQEGECWVYNVKGNRFLRGMVRGLVSTMLKLARGSMSRQQFEDILNGGRQASADFSAPAGGLFLSRVHYPEGYMERLVD